MKTRGLSFDSAEKKEEKKKKITQKSDYYRDGKIADLRNWNQMTHMACYHLKPPISSSAFIQISISVINLFCVFFVTVLHV